MYDDMLVEGLNTKEFTEADAREQLKRSLKANLKFRIDALIEKNAQEILWKIEQTDPVECKDWIQKEMEEMVNDVPLRKLIGKYNAL